MLKHPNVIPITAAKQDSKQQSKQEPIPPIRTGAVTRSAMCQMLAATHSQETWRKSRERSACTAATRGNIVYMPKRSPDDSCNT